jgi:hypothetical protein
MPQYSTTSTGSGGFNTGNFSNVHFYFYSSPRPPEDPYAGALAVLGVPPNSPPDVIRKAFREKIKQVHPDAGGDEVLARTIIEAYKRLVGHG